jgi:hypothetical protein
MVAYVVQQTINKTLDDLLDRALQIVWQQLNGK